MTDRYPPFALDQGGHEYGSAPGGHATLDTPPASVLQPPHGTPPSMSYSPPPPHRPGWTAGRIVSLVLGSLLVLGGLGFAGGGVTLVAADQLARDGDGFMMSPQQRLASDGFAITSEDAQVHTDGTLTRLPDALIGDVRVTVEGPGDADLFLGIAPTAEANGYLADVRYDTLVEVRNGDPVYRPSNGGAPQAPPTAQDFWVAQDTGTDPQLTWTLQDGDWTVVLMHADGSAAVVGDVSTGAEVPMVSTLIAVLFVLAALTLLAGAVLIAIPIRSVNRRQP